VWYSSKVEFLSLAEVERPQIYDMAYPHRPPPFPTLFTLSLFFSPYPVQSSTSALQFCARPHDDWPPHDYTASHRGKLLHLVGLCCLVTVSAASSRQGAPLPHRGLRHECQIPAVESDRKTSRYGLPSINWGFLLII
jgi:hypothetical protein